MISSPSKTGDIEKTTTYGAHGPKELHVIFLDGGRTELAKNPILSQALKLPEMRRMPVRMPGVRADGRTFRRQIFCHQWGHLGRYHQHEAGEGGSHCLYLPDLRAL